MIKKAIVLAGGLGTRLRPVTLTLAKLLMKIQDKTMIEHVFDILKKHGVEEIYVSIGYLGSQLRDYFKDGKDFGLKINYLEENEPLGTAGPLLMLMQNKFNSCFLMLNGDCLFNLNINKMFEFHKKSKAVVTIALTKVDDVTQYGVAKLDKIGEFGGKILEFVEKPKKEEAPSNFINSGWYIMEPEVFEFLKGKSKAMVEKDLFPILAKEGKLFGYVGGGQWFDTGTFERIERAEREWMKK